MSLPTRPASEDLDVLRARTLAELEHQRTRERISPAEFARRSERAVAAASARELRPLVADLLERDAAAVPAPVEAGADAIGTAHQGADHDWAFAVMSGSNRSGRWEPAEHVTALAIMGGVRLDFREAALLEGVETNVTAYCLMGGVEIIVPPDIHVSVAGTGLMGGFGHVRQTASEPDAPRLHITGLAVMGGVDIKVREIDYDTEGDDSP